MKFRSSHIVKAILLLVLALMLATFAGCSRSRHYEDIPMDVAWQKIMQKFNKGRYLDAADRLEIFLINHAGSALADSAQFVLGECHFKMKEYIIAASEYQKLYVQYPQSSLAQEAEYKMGICFLELSPKYSLDQVYTQKAIDTFQLFIEDYPNSEKVDEATARIQELRHKLAHKEFFNGMLYHKMKEYASARIYYELVLDNYYDTEYAPRAQYYIAFGYEKEKQWTEAIEAYTQYLNKFSGHDLEQEALHNLNVCREKLAEGAGKKRGDFLLPAGEMEESTGEDE